LARLISSNIVRVGHSLFTIVIVIAIAMMHLVRGKGYTKLIVFSVSF